MTDVRDVQPEETTEVETVETVDTVETPEADTTTEQEPEGDIVKVPKAELEKLRAAVKKNNKENERNRLKLKEYEAFGSPDEIAESFTKLTSLPDPEEAQKATNALLEKERAKVRAAMEKEIEAARKEAEKYKQNWQATAVDREVTRVLADQTDTPELFLPKLKEMIAHVEDDQGNLHIRIKGEDGEFEINNSGEYATIEDAVLKLREHKTYARLFKAPKPASGAGLKADGKREVDAPKPRKSEMNIQQKLDYISKHTIVEYNKLKD